VSSKKGRRLELTQEKKDGTVSKGGGKRLKGNSSLGKTKNDKKGKRKPVLKRKQSQMESRMKRRNRKRRKEMMLTLS
jgi:hypothetical protein